MKIILLAVFLMMPICLGAQQTGGNVRTPPIEPGVSLELAKWRAAHYGDVRYKLNLTLEKMSPVLKGTIEISVSVGTRTPSSANAGSSGMTDVPIILDWRKIRGHEEKSTISNVVFNGKNLPPQASVADGGVRVPFEEINEHLVFRDGVVAGENVIKLDFTSPILTSGSAITRYIDKEDGSEYIYSLFVPSDASTAFPVFDQPDLKAKFSLYLRVDPAWKVVSNTERNEIFDLPISHAGKGLEDTVGFTFPETKPISTYVFAFAAGPFQRFLEVSKFPGIVRSENCDPKFGDDVGHVCSHIYVRKSQAAKFQPHAAEVFRLNREAIKYFEEYFDYKFPFPKYDLVLIPEFPFGGMEHAGATFLRESAIIFPQEPTKNDHISRALLIFHEASHQWFGDTVTMRWFDDLWLKEGFATFTAYKAMEKIMPEMNAWKVFYERVKQAAYQTDSTKGTTPIYQEIPNLSAAKSAYGNIVYNKAPAFLRQAEFYLGEHDFRVAVRSFLKKNEYSNASWKDLVDEFKTTSIKNLTSKSGYKDLDPKVRQKTEFEVIGSIDSWARGWVQGSGVFVFRYKIQPGKPYRGPNLAINNAAQISFSIDGPASKKQADLRILAFLRIAYRQEVFTQKILVPSTDFIPLISPVDFFKSRFRFGEFITPTYVFPNEKDYGYGIFLLDSKSRDYVLKNIQNEKDPFLRSMMWGALWDSVREGELDPREYVDLVVKVLSLSRRENHPVAEAATPLLRKEGSQEDESTTALLLSRVGTAMNYYMSEPPPSGGGQSGRSPNWPAANAAGSDLRARVEDMLIERMLSSETLGQRITYYRAFLNIASSERARGVLKAMLSEPPASAGGQSVKPANRPANATGENHPVGEAPTPLLRKEGSQKDGRTPAVPAIPLKTKDKFDIVTRLLVLGDADAPKLLAELEKTETSDDAKRYAYAAKAGIGTAENKAKYWNDFVNNKDISESWIEAAFGPWNSIRHSELTLPYLLRALQELPNHKRNRKIFFVNGWLGAFIGGQRSEEALAIVNKFLADNPTLDRDLRLKILENADIIERAVKIRAKNRN